LRTLLKKRAGSPRQAERVGARDQGYRIQFRRDDASPVL
jgi:hypothetical protein